MTDTNEPRKMPAKKPGESKPAGQSMKDRLLAERRAAGGDPPAAKPAPTPAKPAAKPAPATAKPAPAKPTPSAAKPAAAPAKPAATKPAGAAPAARSARPAAGEGGESSGSARRPRREPPPPKKKSPVPFIAAGLLVVVAVVGGKFAMDAMKGEDPAAPADTNTGQAPAGDNTEATADGAATDGAGAAETDTNPDGAAGAAPDAPADAPADKPAPDLSDEDRAALQEVQGLPSAKDPDSWNAIAINKDPNKKNDPDSVDLSKLTPYDKPPGVDQARWDTLTADAKAMFDPLSGAKGTRAEGRLLEAGIDAWPAIMNEFIKLDPARPEDNQTGFRAQKLLDKIRGGTTQGAFDWRTPDVSGEALEPRHLFYNKQLIVELHDVWRRQLKAPTYIAEKIAKGAVQEALRGNAPPPGEDVNVEELDLSDLGGG